MRRLMHHASILVAPTLGLGLVLFASLTMAESAGPVELGAGLQRIERAEAKALAARVRASIRSSAAEGPGQLAVLQLRHERGPKPVGEPAASAAAASMGAAADQPSATAAADGRGHKLKQGQRERTVRRGKTGRSMETISGRLSGSLLDDAARLSKGKAGAKAGTASSQRERQRSPARLAKQQRGAKRLHALPDKTSSRRRKRGDVTDHDGKRHGTGGQGGAGAGATGGAGSGARLRGSGAGVGRGAPKR